MSEGMGAPFLDRNGIYQNTFAESRMSQNIRDG